MGYAFHITRAENWSDNQGFEISSQEWLNIIKNDSELVPMPENGVHFVKWSGSTKYPETWFDWFNGNIYTKALDKATLRKMLQIAHQFNAKIQGDEGETYDEHAIESFDDSFLDKWTTSKSRHFIKLLLPLLALLLIPFFVVIIFLIVELYFK